MGTPPAVSGNDVFMLIYFIFGGGGGGTLWRATPPKIQAKACNMITTS